MKKSKIIIITGLSGSGKSVALDAFEDAGFYCVDNMPVALLPKFLEFPLKSANEISGLAFGMDLREKDFLLKYGSIFKSLGKKGYDLVILFLEAGDETLLRRFSQTRRHHPLAQGQSLLNDIRTEREELKELRSAANLVIDTSLTNVHELKALIVNIALKNKPAVPLRLNVLSFGFKYGLPLEADLVMDVRFIANPYFVEELKDLDGENEAVKEFVLNDAPTRGFIKKYLDLLDYLIPLYEEEGKAYITIAVGCTGGRHRSVSIARAIHQHITTSGRQAEITHRDIEQQT